MGFYTPCPCRQYSWAQGLPCSHLSPACARLGTLTFPQTQDSPLVFPLPTMGGTTFSENLLATCVPFSGQSPCPGPPPTETFLLLLLGLSCVPSAPQPLVPLHPGSLRVVCPGATLPQGLPEWPLRPSSEYNQFRTLQRLPRACKINSRVSSLPSKSLCLNLSAQSCLRLHSPLGNLPLPPNRLLLPKLQVLRCHPDCLSVSEGLALPCACPASWSSSLD